MKRFKNKLLLFLMSALATWSAQVSAEAFGECPTEAFLIQDKVANLYGVQLATGYYQKESPHDWGEAKMNALAFNIHDRYLYAYNYYYGTIVTIDAQLAVSPLWLTGLPNMGFYVGDIALTENSYYLYRPGASYGLYRIPLDPTAADYLTAQQVANGNQINLSIYDMAFHPDNGLAYSVDRWGNLWAIDVVLGKTERISNVGQAGTFGAVYFDVNANLYISRNSDGHIYRVNTQWDYPIAEFFAFGPASSNNDGARCALAPIISIESPTTDFGDAPDSYQTSIGSNGPRHDVGDGSLFLGGSVSGEPNAYAVNGLEGSDNDGVAFVTNFEPGRNSITTVVASAPGYLNAWIDWNRNGLFDKDERIADAEAMQAGPNAIIYRVPNWANVGDTWSRFRLSSQMQLEPVGGVGDGEVEDYEISIIEPNVVVHYHPSEQGWNTLAFEDNWPLKGDYDMNDVVANYRLSTVTNEDKLLRITLAGRIVALGAAYHNGLAFRLTGLTRDQIDEAHITFTINDNPVMASPLETGRDEAIIIISDDLWDYVTAGEQCRFYRTEQDCGSNIQMEFRIIVPLINDVDATDLAAFPFDPFIFSAPNQERGYLFGEAPGRRYEIHLQNQAPTEAFQENFFGRGDDDSDATLGRFYVNEHGMPWALDLPYEWRYPLENMDIRYAYPKFQTHVQSNGALDLDWFVVEQSNSANTFE
ncbi:LruC domain-containing protein [Reinekea sp.]|uniref:LruC domain-containing protein n=1 Tax=Reinekea sp. TaxID=1970455 RepID=UPI002580BE8B|nr:LruC domain-containing protein [Reinekea sp.]